MLMANPSVLIIVEGETDKECIRKIFDFNKEDAEIHALSDYIPFDENLCQYEHTGGFNHLKDTLEKRLLSDILPLLDAECLKAIVLIVDGDNEPISKRLQDIQKAFSSIKEFQETGLIPDFTEKDCNSFRPLTIQTNSKKYPLEFGIYIFQDSTYQDLESFLFATAKTKKPTHHKIVAKFRETLKKELVDSEGQYIGPKYKNAEGKHNGSLNKAIYQIYLHTQQELDGYRRNIDKRLDKFFDFSFTGIDQTSPMWNIKNCYEDLKRIINQDVTAKESP
jgi:hypothetical protein